MRQGGAKMRHLTVFGLAATTQPGKLRARGAWLGRHAPLMDDPGLGRLDRYDGVAPGSESPARPEHLGGSGAAPDLPGRGAR